MNPDPLKRAEQRQRDALKAKQLGPNWREVQETGEGDEKAFFAQLNSESLIALQREFGLVLPRNAPEWRPTKRAKGYINGLAVLLEVLATDGVVCWFRETDTGRLFHGHKAHFSEPVETLHGASAKREGPRGTPKAGKTKKPKTDPLEAAKSLLDSII